MLDLRLLSSAKIAQITKTEEKKQYRNKSSLLVLANRMYPFRAVFDFNSTDHIP